MEELADRKGLARKFGVTYVEGDWPYLLVNHPAGAARVVGEAKDKAAGEGQIFLRGQASHCGGMRPRLFRDVADADVALLRRAERRLVKSIRDKLPQDRFGRDDLPALLQHYGFHTSWLDVVDNLFVAAWFAGRKLRTTDDDRTEVLPSADSDGWLFVLATDRDGQRLRPVDLRWDHHPLSARPHVQHGVSLFAEEESVVDLRNHVVATMRVPLKAFGTMGSMFDSSVMFPDSTLDHTLRVLLKYEVNKMAASAEFEFDVPSGAPGRVRNCAVD